jgi:hypothetical protein
MKNDSPYKVAKVKPELLRRLKAQSVLHQINMQDIVNRALEPVVEKLEQDSYSRFAKTASEKTRK